MNRYLLLYSLYMLMCLSVSAQSVILDEYLTRVTTDNLNLQELKLKVQKQNSKVDQAKALWNPFVDAKVSYLFALGGREIVFPVGDLFNPTYGALNQLLGRQEFPTNLENNRIQLTPNNFLDASIAISKPLINSTLKYNTKLNQAITALVEADIPILENELRLQMRTAYYNYLKTFTALDVITENETLLQEVREFNLKLIKYDKATDEIVSDVDYQIANLQSQKAIIIEQQLVSQALINLLMNEDLASYIIPDTTILKTVNEETLNRTALMNEAKSTRPEYFKIAKGLEVNSINQQLIEKQKHPALGIQGGVGVQSEELSFDTGGPLYTLGLGLTWNILDGGLRKRKIEELEVDRSIINNQQSRLDQSINISILQAQEGLKAITSKLMADQSAMKSAERSYDLIKVRYENQKAILLELLQAQTRLATSQINTAITKYDLLIKRAELDHAIGR